MRHAIVLVGLVVAGAAPAQHASYTYFGGQKQCINSCWRGFEQIPFCVVGLPQIGKTFYVRALPLDNGGSGSVLFSCILTGASRLTPPVTLGNYLGELCQVLTSSEFVTLVPWYPSWGGGRGCEGVARVPFTVPDNPSLAGAHFYQQAYAIVDGGETGMCVADYFSRGGHGVIGF